MQNHRYPDIDELMAHDLEGLLRMVPDPRGAILVSILRGNDSLFRTNPGSSHNHQAWPGGLADHLADMLRLSWLEHAMLSGLLRPRGESLPFTLGSAQVVVFCHDAEKVVLYGDPHDTRCVPFRGGPGGKAHKEAVKWRVIEDWRVRYGLVLDDAERNAVTYTHGEGDDYRGDRRVMNELAAFVGNLDRTGARILHGSGKGLGSVRRRALPLG